MCEYSQQTSSELGRGWSSSVTSHRSTLDTVSPGSCLAVTTYMYITQQSTAAAALSRRLVPVFLAAAHLERADCWLLDGVILLRLLLGIIDFSVVRSCTGVAAVNGIQGPVSSTNDDMFNLNLRKTAVHATSSRR